MSELKVLVSQASSRGVRLHGIAPCIITGKGVGIIAERDFEEGDLLLSVPTSVLKTERQVSQEVRDGRTDDLSVQGLLALDLMLDKSKFCQTWKSLMPKKEGMIESIPFWWDSSLQDLLPEAAAKLLLKQKRKHRTDWAAVAHNFPRIVYDDYVYYWFLVGTRTFYYTHPDAQEELDADECLALVPVADLFNHAEPNCEVSYSPSCYSFHATQPIKSGDELYISYGNHSNDFLLTEYGFCLDVNQWDEISLDSALSPLFNVEQKGVLETENFWGGFVLDSESVCYRTQVALRLLCMPRKEWDLRLQIGFDDEDKYESVVNDILLKALEDYSSQISQTSQRLSNLNAKVMSQRETLTKRWKQVTQLIDSAINRSRN